MISIVNYLFETKETVPPPPFSKEQINKANVRMSALFGAGVAGGRMLRNYKEIGDSIEKEKASAIMIPALLATGAVVGAGVQHLGNKVNDYLDKRKQAKIEEQKRIMREVLKEKKQK